MPPDATPSASSDPVDGDGAWVVPESLRAELAKSYGPVVRGAAVAQALKELGEFATCGDRVTADALALGRPPKLAVIDYHTLRSEPIDRALFRGLASRTTVAVRNPAGMLTDRLWNAIGRLWAAGGGLVEVEGEEDLGALALIAQLPLGATVIYGIPGAGVSFVHVDATAKEHVHRLLDRMERRRVDLGD